MTTSTEVAPQRTMTPYLCNVIAWMGVGCIGAAFGTFVDEQWHALILQTGVVGVLAALGLSKADRYRRAALAERKRNADEAVVEKRLSAQVVALVPREEASQAVDRILDDVRKQDGLPGDRRTNDRTATARRLLTITTMDPRSKGQTISACLKDMSGWGLGFVHQDELPLGPAAVTFVINGEPLSLEVDIRWSQKISKKWFNSGGYFIGARQTQETIDEICEQHAMAGDGDDSATCDDEHAHAATSSNGYSTK